MGFARHRQEYKEQEIKKQEELKKQEQIIKPEVEINKPTRQVNMRVPTETLLAWSSECKSLGLTLTDYLILRVEKGKL